MRLYITASLRRAPMDSGERFPAESEEIMLQLCADGKESPGIFCFCFIPGLLCQQRRYSAKGTAAFCRLGRNLI